MQGDTLKRNIADNYLQIFDSRIGKEKLCTYVYYRYNSFFATKLNYIILQNYNDEWICFIINRLR